MESVGSRPGRRVSEVSTAFYVVSMVVGIVSYLTLLTLFIVDGARGDWLLYVVVPVVYVVGVFCVLLYKAWAVIQLDDAITTPGKAVGLLFVPFLNLFWQFFAIAGWADDFNRFLDERKISKWRVSSTLFTFHSIAILFAGVAVPVTAVFVVVQMCRGINLVAQSEAEAG